MTTRLSALVLGTLIATAQAGTNGIKHWVVTPTGAHVTDTTVPYENLEGADCSPALHCGNGAIADFSLSIGASEATDVCNIKSNVAAVFPVSRLNGGLAICRMASIFAYGTGCTPGTYGTAVCSTDSINAGTLANCSITADGDNSGLTECNP